MSNTIQETERNNLLPRSLNFKVHGEQRYKNFKDLISVSICSKLLPPLTQELTLGRTHHTYRKSMHVF